jgi:anti-sigma factor RsiW
MSGHADIRTEDLHAFIDSELDETRRTQIEQLVARDSEFAALIAAFRSDKDSIARIYGAFSDRPLPQKWLARIERHAASGARRPAIPALAALAASLVLLVIGSAVMTNAPQFTESSIVTEALAARENQLRPESIVAVRGDAELNATSRLLAKTLALRVSAPDLSAMGYSLAALRVYAATPSRRAVELVYRGPAGRDFTLFVRRSSGQVRFDVFERNGVRVCLWQDDVVATVMAGRMSAAEMQRLASLAYDGLSG